jgi:hypothetical protein
MRTCGIDVNKNLNDYIKIYHNHIDKSICEQTIQELNTAKWMKNSFVGYVKSDEVSLSDNELDVTYDDVSTRGVLMLDIHRALMNYIVDDLKFPWFSGWSGYSYMRFNRYNEGQEMAKHCDHITINEDGMRKGVPILSIIGALNDDYEGGELIMFDDEVIELKRGDLMVFPSSFLYPHQVKPVTKGVRDTFVSWVW